MFIKEIWRCLTFITIFSLYRSEDSLSRPREFVDEDALSKTEETTRDREGRFGWFTKLHDSKEDDLNSALEIAIVRLHHLKDKVNDLENKLMNKCDKEICKYLDHKYEDLAEDISSNDLNIYEVYAILQSIMLKLDPCKKYFNHYIGFQRRNSNDPDFTRIEDDEVPVMNPNTTEEIPFDIAYITSLGTVDSESLEAAGDIWDAVDGRVTRNESDADGQRRGDSGDADDGKIELRPGRRQARGGGKGKRRSEVQNVDIDLSLEIDNENKNINKNKNKNNVKNKIKVKSKNKGNKEKYKNKVKSKGKVKSKYSPPKSHDHGKGGHHGGYHKGPGLYGGYGGHLGHLVLGGYGGHGIYPGYKGQGEMKGGDKGSCVSSLLQSCCR